MTLEPGLHEFKMMRSGAQMTYFLDGNEIGTLATNGVQGAYWLRLMFDVDYPAGLPMGPMMVDRVSVVPCPTGGLAIAVLGVLGSRRRR